MASSPSFRRFQDLLFFDRSTGFALDISRMNFELGFLESMHEAMSGALTRMAELERGGLANPDEHRMVGHYWLRDPDLAPSSEIAGEIRATLGAIKEFAAAVHGGRIGPVGGGRFRNLLVVGIGGSALGPQFVTQALTTGRDVLPLTFFDNTDPDGMERALTGLDLAVTLCVVISKSGGTKETRNGQLVAKAAWDKAGVPFARHFVAVTGAGSELDRTAEREGWLARFPMWDWVGGRTSELSAVGLLPAALQGFDIDGLLAGARTMDRLTRSTEVRANPAGLLALMWYHAGCGQGRKDMVVLPYKDRLELFSRYLQQLVMESLGKELDLNGKKVHQGLAVYGNKGSTDQHAYVQQLRDGLNNFFAVFIEVLADRSGATAGPLNAAQLEVEPGVTSGDYLSGFLLGTRAALHESGRESVTITVPEVSARTVGMLIALFERAVGLYAGLINVNAYHQPGVEAGKKAAARVLGIQGRVLQHLREVGRACSLAEIAEAVEAAEAETIFKTLRHLAANDRVRVLEGESVFEDQYQAM